MRICLGIIILITMMQTFALSKYCNPKDYFRTIAMQVKSYKQEVQYCYKSANSFIKCNGGMSGISPDIFQPKGNIASLKTEYGVITVFPVPCGQIISSDSYIQTPTVTRNSLIWSATGMSVEKGYINY